ncbi:MAG: hypothetical protein H7248_03060 [Microbacteriaceae bacterium]|nr:hypothetical protein [Microbacteriaceae bacterium]
MSDATLASRAPGESLMVALRQPMAPISAPALEERLFGRNPIPAAARSW